jgi:PAS domain S-box-containing protein
VSEFLSDTHTTHLSQILRAMCAGDDPEQLIEQFEQSCEAISQEEVAEVFDRLSDEGIEFHQNEDVIAFYHEVVQPKLSAGAINGFPPGHPVRVYLEENQLLRSLFAKARRADPRKDREKFEALFNKICKVELHYRRKENQLFPLLEKHGWDSPSKNMWAFNDQNRALIKEVRQALEADDLNTVIERFPIMQSELERMMSVEEHTLLPNAMNLLDEKEWEDMRLGDEEIGWMLDQAPPPYPPREEKPEEKARPARSKPTGRNRELPFSVEDRYHYDEGFMTPEQVNLIFRHLPVDITYVDENDRVVFYNRGEDRVFPRSANIIGREVKNCHPPKSIDTVLRIVEEFRAGTKDVADFWINIRGRKIHIRYFAVRDLDRTYRGVLEMSQDITEIQQLEGEQRLLDWD